MHLPLGRLISHRNVSPPSLGAFRPRNDRSPGRRTSSVSIRTRKLRRRVLLGSRDSCSPFLILFFSRTRVKYSSCSSTGTLGRGTRVALNKFATLGPTKRSRLFMQQLNLKSGLVCRLR